ncbi:MAG: SDR family NAD(P)-dependent oxidoreductase, partial [Nitrospirae bacterium]|nr:SDR family NAD(P)-dependent oxidoreductase [Nitrospirota bacterium]
YTAYFERQKQGGAKRHDPYPRVILVPGLGMWTTGENVKSAGIARDLYVHTISVIKGAAAVGEYASISEKEVYDMEYWPMELYKLTLAPPEAALSRRVALVTGAASGIGRAICFKLAREGAHVVATDLREDSVRDLAGEINGTFGSGRASFARMDVTDEASVAASFQAAALAYGGVDIVVSNAGLAHRLARRVPDDEDPGDRRDVRLRLVEERLLARQGVRRLLRLQGGRTSARQGPRPGGGRPRDPRQHGEPRRDLRGVRPLVEGCSGKPGQELRDRRERDRGVLPEAEHAQGADLRRGRGGDGLLPRLRRRRQDHRMHDHRRRRREGRVSEVACNR